MSRFDDLSKLLSGFVTSGLPGCACALAKDGEILWEGYFGYADLERKIPMNETSVFRLASMTKVIICTAALILYERGQFLLSDPVYEYIPEYKETYVY
ncbi:serine hydrolase domain-containing protein [Anaerocellum danielii]|uniref:Serine hydrolase domain-containing protein n=1 Tax=Anaerocellum danielii TaxID=1387557 RepID=A0ABZ0TY12_9FIRM|nr:serine hydrolase domain-containing protein [Caldicellulosiruptor danielii]WPX08305.1 serine hydrolase domain-containing protein [Caldicellulosiruptor danielii]